MTIEKFLIQEAKIMFKKLHPDAVLPSHSKPGDAGLDLTAVEIELIDNGMDKHYYGMSVEIPEGYVGLVFPRSSIYKQSERLSNSVGVIDSGYRGEISAVFDNKSLMRDQYTLGDRTAQLVIVPFVTVQSEWAEELTETERGEGGYGSTGK